MKTTTILGSSLVLALSSTFTLATPLGTAFTYQGRLNEGPISANGSYELKFTLFDTNSDGTIVAGPITNSPVAVSNGLFAVQLDFGSVFDGSARWLEIGVRSNGAGTDFTLLSPRQLLTPAPSALYAPNAGTASTAALATSASGAPWSGLTGVPAGFADGVDGDTTYSAGDGLTLTGSVFSMNFAGSGTTNTAARSDHDHASVYAPQSHTHTGEDIATGTLADTRLSANIARLNANQGFTGSNTFSGVSVLTNAANQFAGTFDGNGAGLTNLALANNSVTSATIADGAIAAADLGPATVTETKLADGAVTAAKLADTAAVKTLNGLAGQVVLSAGSNVTLTAASNTISISASGGVGGGAGGIPNGMQEFTASGTNSFVVPAGITRLLVEVWGGGGNGGSRWQDEEMYYHDGGGGGAGGYSRKLIAVSPGETYRIVITTNTTFQTASGTVLLFANQGNTGYDGYGGTGAGGTGDPSATIARTGATGWARAGGVATTGTIGPAGANGGDGQPSTGGITRNGGNGYAFITW